MTYTTQQLQAMSDFEVNKALCLKLGYDVSGINEQRNMMTGAVIDYCSNPNDIMPLAFERKIGLAPNKDSWEAFTLADNFQVISRQYVDKSPLRAIACLLLMMDEKAAQ